MLFLGLSGEWADVIAITFAIRNRLVRGAKTTRPNNHRNCTNAAKRRLIRASTAMKTSQ